LRESEVFCLHALNFNLSRTTAKQYLDIMYQVGFLFDDELNFIEERNPVSFYIFGYKLLKEFISSFESTQYPSLTIAFSILVFLREFQIKQNPKLDETTETEDKNILYSSSDFELKKFLIMKKHRIKFFESIYNIQENCYINCYEKLKKKKCYGNRLWNYFCRYR